uniref:Uncharacterized protein n=1 Tax=viral metagenome TaxID=1070528 RepID=A0A6M3XND3_9ZZZZ
MNTENAITKIQSDKWLEEAGQFLQEACVEFEKNAVNIAIATDDDKEIAAYFLADIKKLLKEIESRRVQYVTPFNEKVKAANGWCKQYSSRLEAADKSFKAKILAYEKKLADDRRRVEEEARKREEDRLAKLKELEQKEITPEVQQETRQLKDDQVAEQIHLEETKRDKTQHFSGVSTTIKQVWTFEVENVAELPTDYLLPNEPLIRKAVNAGVRTIPGVRIFQKDQLSSRF